MGYCHTIISFISIIFAHSASTNITMFFVVVYKCLFVNFFEVSKAKSHIDWKSIIPYFGIVIIGHGIQDSVYWGRLVEYIKFSIFSREMRSIATYRSYRSSVERAFSKPYEIVVLPYFIRHLPYGKVVLPYFIRRLQLARPLQLLVALLPPSWFTYSSFVRR